MLRKSPLGLVYPLQGLWRIRYKTLPADQNIFGLKLPQRNKGRHFGWDLIASVGTPVYAIAPGKVVYKGFVEGYGNLIKHSFTFREKTFYVLYAHLQTMDVKADSSVAEGAIIGKTGISGTSGIEPHLHLEFQDVLPIKAGPAGKVNPDIFFGEPPIISEKT
jgi:murein DD-endopeptidase MepM/ murein hydrolase activator NlpD